MCWCVLCDGRGQGSAIGVRSERTSLLFFCTWQLFGIPLLSTQWKVIQYDHPESQDCETQHDLFGGMVAKGELYSSFTKTH